MPRIRPEEFLDYDEVDNQELVIEDDEPRDNRGQIIKPKNPMRQEPSWEENRRRFQRKNRRDFD